MRIQHRLALALLAATALAPAPARAQLPALNLLEAAPKDVEAEERRAKVDEAYRNSQIRNAPAQQQAADPWGSIRAAPAPAKPAAPAKKQAGAKEGGK